jgi:AraC family transcriptional regulator of adaptative response/methylated-DNA-[protein]-cysteine methyltransferase
MTKTFEYIAIAAESETSGKILFGRTDAGVCWLSLAVDMAEQRRQMAEQLGRQGGVEVSAGLRPELGRRARLEAASVARALDAGSAFPSLPLDLRGTEFQRSVWEALLRLPANGRSTYSDLAEALGMDSRASRAVGTAVGANPVSLLVPCHLIARRDGGLGGYRWGLDAKRRLLGMLEGATA